MRDPQVLRRDRGVAEAEPHRRGRAPQHSRDDLRGTRRRRWIDGAAQGQKVRGVGIGQGRQQRLEAEAEKQSAAVELDRRAGKAAGGDQNRRRGRHQQRIVQTERDRRGRRGNRGGLPEDQHLVEGRGLENRQRARQAGAEPAAVRGKRPVDMCGERGPAGHDLDMARAGVARDARVIDDFPLGEGEVDRAAGRGRRRRVLPELDARAEPACAADRAEQRQYAAGAEQEGCAEIGRPAREARPSGAQAGSEHQRQHAGGRRRPELRRRGNRHRQCPRSDLDRRRPGRLKQGREHVCRGEGRDLRAEGDENLRERRLINRRARLPMQRDGAAIGGQRGVASGSDLRPRLGEDEGDLGRQLGNHSPAVGARQAAAERTRGTVGLDRQGQRGGSGDLQATDPGGGSDREGQRAAADFDPRITASRRAWSQQLRFDPKAAGADWQCQRQRSRRRRERQQQKGCSCRDAGDSDLLHRREQVEPTQGAELIDERAERLWLHPRHCRWGQRRVARCDGRQAARKDKRRRPDRRCRCRLVQQTAELGEIVG